MPILHGLAVDLIIYIFSPGRKAAQGWICWLRQELGPEAQAIASPICVRSANRRADHDGPKVATKSQPPAGKENIFWYTIDNLFQRGQGFVVRKK